MINLNKVIKKECDLKQGVILVVNAMNDNDSKIYDLNIQFAGIREDSNNSDVFSINYITNNRESYHIGFKFDGNDVYAFAVAPCGCLCRARDDELSQVAQEMGNDWETHETDFTTRQVYKKILGETTYQDLLDIAPQLITAVNRLSELGSIENHKKKDANQI